METDDTPSTDLRWYRTLYWRIGFGFLALIVGLLVLQSLMFSYIVSRSRETLPGGSPNRFAALVAADVASALAQNPDLDVQQLRAGAVRGDPEPRLRGDEGRPRRRQFGGRRCRTTSSTPRSPAWAASKDGRSRAPRTSPGRRS